MRGNRAGAALANRRSGLEQGAVRSVFWPALSGPLCLVRQSGAEISGRHRHRHHHAWRATPGVRARHGGHATPRLLTAAQAQSIFPSAETRAYPLGQAQTFALVEQIIQDHGWDVRLVRAPDAALAPAQINAQIMTIPGWREEAVVRVTGTATTAMVDMRSASLNALHDFGANGQRIERFLAELDDAVTVLLRDNPNVNQPDIEPVEDDVAPLS
ncbi:DUF1499 domain-containing protein [Devosia sp. J2-20]|uniref:DUF1499 domain-containing protein n=1 Tax=Devosia sp. J2-20 TaxID=3026161 RepID=UPI00249B4179|nr:DUF1499 domain-containing protein [Devosia sp. J2-20]WDQ97662.1 DUF1499 domain-containing protein [Devosia sp. J2-20]